MKKAILLSLLGWGTTAAMAQNSVVINQSGSPSGAGHEVSIVQQGSGNNSVVNQSEAHTQTTGSRAVINQSGTGNVATVNQGNGQPDSIFSSGQSVNVSQSGAGETVIDQTDGSNKISIRQRGPETLAPIETKPIPADKRKKGRSGTKPSN